MEIIKKGKIPSEGYKKVYEINCTHCNTYFTCVEEDLEYHEWEGDRLNIRPVFASVKCPICGHEIFIGHWTPCKTL